MFLLFLASPTYFQPIYILYAIIDLVGSQVLGDGDVYKKQSLSPSYSVSFIFMCYVNIKGSLTANIPLVIIKTDNNRWWYECGCVYARVLSLL